MAVGLSSPSGSEHDPLSVSIKDFLGTDTGYFRDFVEEIKSLSESMQILAGGAQQQIAKGTAALGHYDKGYSERASRGGSGVLGSQIEPQYSVRTQREMELEAQSAQTEEIPVQDGSSGGGLFRRLIGRSAGASMPSMEARAERGKEMEVPQIGEFTTQNVAQMLSYAAASRAQMDPATGQPTGFMAQASDTLYGLSQGLIPKASIAHEYINELGAMGKAYSEYGEQLGTPSSQGTMTVGPLRIPLPGSSSFKGATQAISDKITGAITPGLSGAQVSEIRSNTASLGWYGDAGEAVNDWGRNITQYSSRLGENPLTYQLMDKAVRQGSASLEQMTAVMKNIPDAADRAHISWEQLMSDMDQFGEANQSRGGTHYTGQLLAQTATMTGNPPEAVAGMIGAPISQAMMYTYGGVAPWATGALSPEAQMNLSMRGFNLGAQATSGIGGATMNLGGGFKEHVSGVEQQAATLHATMFPDMSPEVIQEMLKSPKKQREMRDGFNTVAAGRAFSTQIGAAQKRFERNPTDPRAVRGLTSRMNKSADYEKMMKGALGPDGKPLFTDDEINNVMEPFQDFKGWLEDDDDKEAILRKAGITGTTVTGMAGKGAAYSTTTYPDIESLKGADLKRVQAAAAKYMGSETFNRAKDLYAEKMPQDDTPSNGSDAVIELGPQAARYFHLETPQTSAKAFANSGMGLTTNSRYSNYPTNVGTPPGG